MSSGTLPPSALERLPIFPLKNLVLFPGAVLPLHVFEERYRQLAEDVLSGSRIIGVPRLLHGEELPGEERPPIYSTFGIGYVIGSKKLEDGRYNLVLRGVGRVTYEGELPARRLYREVYAKPLVDTRSSRAAELQTLHQTLLALCDKFADSVEGDGGKLKQLVRAGRSPAQNVDIIAAALVTNIELRQALLEALDPADRLDLVIQHLGELLSHMPQTGSAN